MRVIQCYQQGGKHSLRNHPCEDRTYGLKKNGVSVIALADGAGSEKYVYAADGAETITKAICSYMSNCFDELYNEQSEMCLKHKIISYCHSQLKRKAAELEINDIVKLSSTMLCVAVKNNKVLILHIGDGVIGKLTPDGTQLVSKPKNGEFASETYFVTNANSEKHLSIKKEHLNSTLAYFMMSDGVADYIYDECTESFLGAAEKLARMSYEDEGNQMLSKAFQKYMISADPLSDDCSFICMGLRNPDKEYILANTKSLEKEKALMPLELFDKLPFLSNKDEDKKRFVIYILSLFLVVILVILVAWSIHNKNDSKETETTRPQITHSVETTSKTATTSESSKDNYSDELANKEKETSDFDYNSKKVIKESESDKTDRTDKITNRYKEENNDAFNF